MLFRTSRAEADQTWRMFCRPIHSGFGEITVRPIGPADEDLAQAFVTGLSATSRHLRFFQVLQCLSPSMLRRFVHFDPTTHVALAAIATLDGKSAMVGEARYAADAGGASAEIAVAVTDHWQRRGLATQLMARLERIAAAAGIVRLTGECLAINDGFAGLARSLGFQVRPEPGDSTLLQIEKVVGMRAGAGGRRSPKGATALPAIGRADWGVASIL